MILVQNIVYKTRNFRFFQKNKKLQYKLNTVTKTSAKTHTVQKNILIFKGGTVVFHVMDYCGLLWVTVVYCWVFYLLDAGMSSCFFSNTNLQPLLFQTLWKLQQH